MVDRHGTIQRAAPYLQRQWQGKSWDALLRTMRGSYGAAQVRAMSLTNEVRHG